MRREELETLVAQAAATPAQPEQRFRLFDDAGIAALPPPLATETAPYWRPAP